MKKQNEFLLIVDGSSLLATSYYSSLPKALRKEKDEAKKEEMYPRLLKKDKSGRYCNALELFFHTLFTIMTFQHPSHLVVCWDAGRNTFRKELWPSYKSNRQETPGPLREQFESCYELCEKLNICQVRDTRYEADDFAGSIAFQMRDYLPVRILTRDKDYFQLIDERIHIWYGMADLKKVKAWRKTHHMPSCLPSRVVQIDEAVLKKEFGYHAAAVPMIKCLYGDPSDNIPGVSGMGENRSIKLAEHYHTIEELYEPIEAARTKADRKKLARLWKSWGINISPFAVLSRKGSKDRLNARQMAEICYTLGKIRTDLDLADCFEQEFSPELFRCRFEKNRIYPTLRLYNIDLKIGRSSSIPGEDPAERRKKRARKASGKKAQPGSRKGGHTAASPKPAAKSVSASQTARSAGKPEARKTGNKPNGQTSRPTQSLAGEKRRPKATGYKNGSHMTAGKPTKASPAVKNSQKSQAGQPKAANSAASGCLQNVPTGQPEQKPAQSARKNQKAKRPSSGQSGSKNRNRCSNTSRPDAAFSSKEQPSLPARTSKPDQSAARKQTGKGSQAKGRKSGSSRKRSPHSSQMAQASAASASAMQIGGISCPAQ